MKVAIYNPFYKKVIILPFPFFVSSTLKINLIIETEFGFILVISDIAYPVPFSILIPFLSFINCFSKKSIKKLFLNANILVSTR